MTKIINIKNNENNALDECAFCIRNGGTAIFPTETVYGIGTNALDKEAVDKIFKIKERSKKNPLIVLVSNIDMLNSIVNNITEVHRKLIEHFWPGPLTIIFDKCCNLPDSVTGGLDTVGVRIPSNEIAINLIEKAGVPLIAPSANISGKLSIVDVSVALKEFDGKVDYIVDGGISDIGIESTIVKVEGSIIKILRQGKILAEDIQKIGFNVSIDSSIIPSKNNKHYDIGKEVFVVTGNEDVIIEKIDNFLLENKTKKIGVIGFDEHYDIFNEKVCKYVNMGKNDNDIILKNLFNTLNEAKESNVDVFLIESLKSDNFGKIIMNKFTEVCNNKFI